MLQNELVNMSNGLLELEFELDDFDNIVLSQRSMAIEHVLWPAYMTMRPTYRKTAGHKNSGRL